MIEKKRAEDLVFSFLTDEEKYSPGSTEKKIILRDWTAQDFSRIYFRYSSHLVNYARRYLRDPVAADEVVQDAFLYLLTALPELDTELGVLRFLKWKIRNLCFDLLRTQRGSLSLEELPKDELFPDDEIGVAEQIERADDAAIVQLALAQLAPRHRQALVSTLIEEKSSKVAANEMGLSENAFRQLLLRARRSFKQVFVGEAANSDLSVNEALRLASKKHRLKIISGTSILLLVSVFNLDLDWTTPSQFRAFNSADTEGLFASPDPGSDVTTPSVRRWLPDSAPSSPPNAVSISEDESQLIPQSPSLKTENLVSEGNLDTSVERQVLYDPEIMKGASLFLDTLSGDSVMTADYLGGGITSLELAEGYKIKFLASENDEGNFVAVNFITLEWSSDDSSFTAIPLSTYISHEVAGEIETLQVVASGWVVLNVSDPSEQVAVENSHFYEIGLEISAQRAKFSDFIWSASYLPRT